MDKEILLKVLQLDSIIRKLTWEERMIVHFQIQGKTEGSTGTIESIYNWIRFHKWQAPEMRYGQDRLLYVKSNSNHWISIEDFRIINDDI